MAELHVVVCLAFDHRADAVGLQRFRNCICSCPFVDVAMEVSGTFDMIVQGKVATLAEYTEQMALIGPQIAEFVTKIETNFVAKKIERHHETEKFMWVPCVGGRKRIDIATIDKIIAEGDYMRLFVSDWHCLIHCTISALREQLDARFIQLHRSSIVRIDFIERLMHRERRWVARLQDGSQQTVAKSHVAAVLQLAAYDSSKDEPKPTKPDTMIDPCHRSDEKELQRAK